MPEPTIYELAGGAETFARLVENFYNAVQQDELLRPIYPGEWDESKRTLRLFLMQYFGGPGDYSAERGHPRLRLRHLPFAIGQAERDAWMRHMTAAIDAENFAPELHKVFITYFERTATFMMNR